MSSFFVKKWIGNEFDKVVKGTKTNRYFRKFYSFHLIFRIYWWWW